MFRSQLLVKAMASVSVVTVKLKLQLKLEPSSPMPVHQRDLGWPDPKLLPS